MNQNIISSKSIFLAVTSGIISLSIKKALKTIGIGGILHFYSCERMVERVYCYRPPPDLIITETFSQNDMDGFEAAELICQKYNVPFIFLCSFPINKSNKICSCNSSFIPIPFDENKLIVLIRDLLEPTVNNQDSI